MSFDDRIQRLKGLLAQVKLRAAEERPSSLPPPPAPPYVTAGGALSIDEGAPFDAEATLVEPWEAPFDRTQETAFFASEAAPDAPSDDVTEDNAAALDVTGPFDTMAELEGEESAPASSKRPTRTSSRPPAPGFHEAPPESGKQIAAPPMLDDDADENESDVTGVRNAASLGLPEGLGARALALGAEAPGGAAARVASFAGAMRDFQPRTFGELLAATLEL